MFAGRDNFHLFPVVGKFLAAIQAHDVGARSMPRFRSSNREGAAGVSAAEHRGEES